jgi:hypothetical protein
MRKLHLLGVVSLVVAACSDAPTGPPNPLETAPTVRMSHMGGDPATDDLCEGLSPCDAYGGYVHGLTGVPGFCFLPPTVDNHLSDPACSGDFVPGLDGIFKLAWCEVSYPNLLDGSQPPTIVSCQDPSQWQDLVRNSGGGEFYEASVRWRRPDVGRVFRLYVVRADQHFAHRDVIVDPNLTTPADGFVKAIGTGNEPIKIRITQSFECVYYDTQGETPENAATCLIAGATSFSFETERVTATFNFPDGNPTFIADFEVSECLSLGFDSDGLGGATGNALVDVPLADCKLSLSSEELDALTVPAQIDITVNDPRWVGVGGAFGDARLNVLQYDEFGLGALPPTVDPGWFGPATSSSAFLRLLDWGLDKLVGLLTPEPLLAWPGAGFDFTRLSDFEVALMPIMDHDMVGTACASGLTSCLDLGTFAGGATVPVAVQVTAPPREGPSHFAVPDARLHIFPEDGTVACPASPAPGQQCFLAGADDTSTTPASTWDHLVVITGSDGRAVVDWTLDDGDNVLRVAACGIARPGANEPNPPGEPGADHVWGSLGDCTDRFAAMTASGAYDNGPADGHTPFEPVDVTNEVAVYGLPLVFEAQTCPQITIDGTKSPGEWDCADVTGFIAPTKGPKPSTNNAWLRTYTTADAVYISLEVINDELGNRAFINLVEDALPAADDDVLVLDFASGAPGVAQDWFYTQACVGNNASSLCGSPDTTNDGANSYAAAAALNGAGTGRVYYEFKRPLGANPAEDLDGESGQQIGLRITVTQGQGGGKGGFVYPADGTFHRFPLQ